MNSKEHLRWLGLLLVVIGIGTQLQAQTNVWTWKSGSNTPGTKAVFGTKGLNPARFKLGARDGASMWKGASGNLWFFGGASNNGIYNDLWTYNPATALWICVAGDTTPFSKGSYGSLGVQGSPGARYGQSSWTDNAGNLWIFGGYGEDGAGNLGLLNDVWEFNITSLQWIWFSGSNTAGSNGVYGTQGVLATGNIVPARMNAGAWMDKGNNIWVFGGQGSGTEMFNDLWVYIYSDKLWIWVRGKDTTDAPGTYGSPGVGAYANSPGARYSMAGGVDASGNIWIFGGTGRDSAGNIDNLNDLWEFRVADEKWIWVSGSMTVDNPGVYSTLGSPSATGVPGARTSPAGWIDASGDIWIFGGDGIDGSNKEGYLNDLWEYSPAAREWTWVRGSDTAGQPGVYGSEGITAPTSTATPGGRILSASTIDAAGNLWLFGGGSLIDGKSIINNDLWEYSPSSNDWAWVGGDSTPNSTSFYGGLPSQLAGVHPGKRYMQSSWTDVAGNVWLFGGVDDETNTYNDLWEYSPSTGLWFWISGDSIPNGKGASGQLGDSSAAYEPSSRMGQCTWVDKNGYFWIFGGWGNDDKGDVGYLDDLWRYNPKNGKWTWITGYPNWVNLGLTTMGLSSSTDVPGSRAGAGLIYDSSTNQAYLVAGSGYEGSSYSYLCDGWTYDLASNVWTQIFPDQFDHSGPNYGRGGYPGGRANFAYCNQNGNILLFGGNGTGGSYSDIWEFSPQGSSGGFWQFIGGSRGADSAGNYGSQGITSPGSNPPARTNASMWTDQQGNYWIFGGQTNIDFNVYDYNDLWEYSHGSWTWMGGSNMPDQPGNYGTQNMPSSTNMPGARYGQSVAVDKSGTVWMYGGYDINLYNYPYNDLWSFAPTTVIALPLEEVTLEGSAGNQENLLTWQTVGELNTSQFVVERSTDGVNFSNIGTVTAIGSGDNSYSFTDTHVLVSISYYYRIEMLDKNGSTGYSQTVFLQGPAASGLVVYPNPATTFMMVQMADNKLLNTPLRLLDLNGRLISEQVITSQQQLVDLSRLASGVYLLQLANGSTVKILKQ